MKKKIETWKVFRKSNRGIYEVSNMGRIRLQTTAGTMKLICSYPSGGNKSSRYPCLSFNDSKYVHRIVAEAFIANPDNLPCVDHINGDKTDNRVENLRWVSYSQNMTYFYARTKNK